MSALRASAGEFWHSVPRRERLLLIAAMAASALLVIVYAIARQHEPLVGDQPEYDSEGRFFTSGHPWWSTIPFGVAHASAWKAPLYPAWVGVMYAMLGAHHVAVGVFQGLVLAPLTVFLTWLLAPRIEYPGALKGPRQSI